MSKLSRLLELVEKLPKGLQVERATKTLFEVNSPDGSWWISMSAYTGSPPCNLADCVWCKENRKRLSLLLKVAEVAKAAEGELKHLLGEPREEG